MAEGIFKSLIKEHGLNIEVSSAGTSAFNGDYASDNSIRALSNMGMDISKHKSTIAHEDLVNNADLILAMADSHKQVLISKFPRARNKIFLLNEFAFGDIKDISDPFGRGLMDYEKIRDEIYQAAERIVEKLVLNNDNSY